MEPRVLISLKGDRIPVSAFIDAASDLCSILNEVDKAITGASTLLWFIYSLRSGSADLETTPHLLEEEEVDNRERIVSIFVQGMQRLTSQPLRPDYFSDEALIKAKHLANILDGKVDRILLRGTIEGRLSDDIIVTQRVAAHVDELFGFRRKSLGSVEGTLEVISIHGGESFNIYDKLTGRRIKCICDERSLQDLTSYGNLGRRILVYGEIREDVRGYPLSIKLQNYRFLRDREDLPQPADLRGIFSNLPTHEGN